MSCEFEPCGREFHEHQRTVTVELEGGRKRVFCDDRCERRWLEAELKRQRQFMNRIYVSTRGRAHDIAHVALHTNESP